MTIGAISFQPYVYNVNAISPASMNRLSKISDDVLYKRPITAVLPRQRTKIR